MLQLIETSTVLDELLSRICRKLQITETQQKQAESAYGAIATLLETPQSPVVSFRPRIFPQGSLRLGTTVRPRIQDEFDLDIVCKLQIDPRQLSNPLLLIDAIYGFLRAHPVYKDKVVRKNRCVRVNYAGQFHLDILPACPDPRNGNSCLVVPDRASKGWKPSNPEGYAAWFEGRCELVERRLAAMAEPIPPAEEARFKAMLKLTTQLIKRWRDVEFDGRPDLSPISIVLTTLAGQHYAGEQAPTEALVSVARRILDSIPSVGRLYVYNPTNHEEDLSEKWGTEPRTYDAFVSGIQVLNSQLIALLQAEPLHAQSKVLERMFGEEVTSPVFQEYAQSMKDARDDGKLSARRHSGVLTSAAVMGAVPVRPHTFYGDAQKN